MLQKTIKSDIFLTGIGVHTGSNCNILIKPMPENYGIKFILKNFDDDEIIANCLNVSDTSMSSRITSVCGNNLMTIEHIAAAFYGLQISNVLIEVSGKEIPILDGSAKIFIDEIKKVGVKQQAAKQKRIVILKKVRVESQCDWGEFSPVINNDDLDNFSINIMCNYEKKGLQTKPFVFDFLKDDFKTEIAPARTFGFFEDVDFLRKHNLALGASLENTVVFDTNGNPINNSNLRFHNEPIRHKILDIIGDFSLLQYRIVGKFDGYCTSHRLNNEIVRKLLSDKTNFKIIE